MKAEEINSAEDAQRFCVGLINDFEMGLCEKSDVMGELGKYTGRIMEIFWHNALIKVGERKPGPDPLMSIDDAEYLKKL
jgi:hypothetical protein